MAQRISKAHEILTSRWRDARSLARSHILDAKRRFRSRMRRLSQFFADAHAEIQGGAGDDIKANVGARRSPLLFPLSQRVINFTRGNTVYTQRHIKRQFDARELRGWLPSAGRFRKGGGVGGGREDTRECNACVEGNAGRTQSGLHFSCRGRPGSY